MDQNTITLATTILTVIISAITSIAIISFTWGKLTQSVKNLEEGNEKFSSKLDKILEKIETVTNRISHLEGQIVGSLDPLTKRNSPIKLTEKGEDVLTRSGAISIVDDPKNKRGILNKILADPTPTNAYDAQEKTINIINQMENDNIFMLLKSYAYKEGLDLHSILYAVAIYFRKYVLEELCFKEEDCDK